MIYTDKDFIEDQKIYLLAFQGLLTKVEGQDRKNVLVEIEGIEQYLSTHGQGVDHE